MMRRPRSPRDNAAALEESNEVPTLELAPDNHIAFGVNAMNLKN
jgi:hypothetical protein